MVEQKNPCPVCKDPNIGYEFRTSKQTLFRCVGCDLLFVPQLDRDPTGYSVVESWAQSNKYSGPLAIENQAENYLDKLKARGIKNGSRLWAAGKDVGYFIDRAQEAGFKSIDDSFDQIEDNSIDACVLLANLGESSYPLEQLLLIRKILKPGAILLVTMPTLDSDAARRQKSQWDQFMAERLTYFDRHGLAALLVRAGYGQITMCAEAGGVVAACCMEARENVRPLLSIVLPVYNERTTFEQLIQSVLEKTFDAMNREIIIVESNSTDGSRELVQQYENQPGVKVVYEDKPRGKGYAVRNGLNHALGSIILIQDADLEYDIEDYDALLVPIASYRRLFVLGSRHKGHWKMREFEDRNLLSAVFNSGQLFFTWLINITCGTQLKDPFTMYKVFHRECLYGLELEANRFDLDWEIVIKFIRKGFVPMEIPVNYTSRSFGEGKKVRPLIDPMLWLVALLKFRYGRLYGTTASRQR
jgi:hypothetical protein